jgi:hypothetical protein
MLRLPFAVLRGFMASSLVFRLGLPMDHGLMAASLSGVVVGVLLNCDPVLAKELLLSQPQVPCYSVSFTAAQEKALPALKQAELQKLRAIDSLNHQNEACVKGSTSLKALDLCHHKSRRAMDGLRESFHQQISQLRDSYGLPKPNPPQHHRHEQADQR